MGIIKSITFILIVAFVLGGCPAKKMAPRNSPRKGYIVDQYEKKKEVKPYDESYWCCKF